MKNCLDVVLFSIIVPIYNVEKYLKRCIDSLINQTYKNIEIILVDDGSPDNCPKICEEYAAKDNRIKVFHKENGGLSDARNYGLGKASGDYVLFIDSDDWLNIESIEQFNSFLEKDPTIDIAIGNLINADGTMYSKIPKAEIGKAYNGEDYFVQFNNSIIPCAVAPAYRREFLLENKLKFMVGVYHEDNEFTPRAYIQANKIVYTGISFYIRYVREDSITGHKDKRKNLLDLLKISIGLVEYANGLNNGKTKKCLLNRICDSYLSLFYESNIYQYKNENYSKFVSKELVKKTAISKRNKLKRVIFVISPRLYIIINKFYKKF